MLAAAHRLQMKIEKKKKKLSYLHVVDFGERLNVIHDHARKKKNSWTNRMQMTITILAIFCYFWTSVIVYVQKKVNWIAFFQFPLAVSFPIQNPYTPTRPTMYSRIQLECVHVVTAPHADGSNIILPNGN